MPLFIEMERFLTANGVDSPTAKQASTKIRTKVQKSTSLSDNELALAGEFLSSVNVRADSQSQQLKSLIDKSQANQRGVSLTSYETAAKIKSKIATKLGTKLGAKLGAKIKSEIAGKVFSPVAAEIRQLAVSVARA
jgi:hypothetical protein